MSAHRQNYIPEPQQRVRTARRRLLIPLVIAAVLWALTLGEPNAPVCAAPTRTTR